MVYRRHPLFRPPSTARGRPLQLIRRRSLPPTAGPVPDTTALGQRDAGASTDRLSPMPRTADGRAHRRHRLRHLDRLAEQLVSDGLAPAPLRLYRIGVRRFRRFCARLDIPARPATERPLLRYVAERVRILSFPFGNKARKVLRNQNQQHDKALNRAAKNRQPANRCWRQISHRRND